MLNIFFSQSSIIDLVAWVIVAFVATMRYFKVSIFARVSWRWLVAITVVLHLGYAAFLTWGQYVVWENNEFTKIFLAEPLSPDAPLPIIFEWTRPYFERPLGYFAFYSFGRFFSGIIALFVMTGMLVAFLKIRARYRPINFAENDISAIALAVLIAGWPGVIALIPLGFLCAIFISLGARILYGIERIYLPPAFLIVAPIALTWGASILEFFNLYALLKL